MFCFLGAGLSSPFPHGPFLPFPLITPCDNLMMTCWCPPTHLLCPPAGMTLCIDTSRTTAPVLSRYSSYLCSPSFYKYLCALASCLKSRTEAPWPRIQSSPRTQKRQDVWAENFPNLPLSFRASDYRPKLCKRTQPKANKLGCAFSTTLFLLILSSFFF